MEGLFREASQNQYQPDDFNQLSLSLWETIPHVQERLPDQDNFSRPANTFEVRGPPEGETPRDRLLADGPKVLSTAELLSLVLGSNARATLALAYQILQTVQEDTDHLSARLRHVTVQELMEVPGIGLARASAIVAAIELGKRVFYPPATTMTVVDDPAIAAAALSADLMWEEQERFAVLFLDVKHRLIASKVIHIGSASETIAHPRDIFREALRRGATRLIVAHNHPSGSLTPSPEDINLTEQLLQGARFMGLPVLDHLILGQGNYISLRQTTSLWNTYPQDE